MHRPDMVVTQRDGRLGRWPGVGALAVVAVLVAMPWWAGRGTIHLTTEFLYFVGLAAMWNLLAGYGGLVSVGQQAFVGIGGYSVVAFALLAGVNPFVSVVLGGVTAAILAVPTAFVVFRLRGPYFAVGTWAVAEVYRLLVANVGAFGGGSGTSLTGVMSGISPWSRQSIGLWLAIAIGGGATAAIFLFLRSRYGLSLMAIRDSDRASRSIGIRVEQVKRLVYVASAFGCGLCGGLIYVTKLRISPDAAFSIDWTIAMVFVVVIGGVGTIEGPIVGAAVFFLLRELLGDFGTVYVIVLGMLAVVTMLYFPKGIWGYVIDRFGLSLFPIRRRVCPPPADAALRAVRPADRLPSAGVEPGE